MWMGSLTLLVPLICSLIGNNYVIIYVGHVLCVHEVTLLCIVIYDLTFVSIIATIIGACVCVCDILQCHNSLMMI